jgi:hypothetical protein
MTRIVLTSTLAALVASIPAAAQQPQVVNGRVAPEAGGAALDRTFHAIVAAQTDPAWIGYAVPIVSGDRTICCSGGDGTWISDGVAFSSGRLSPCGIDGSDRGTRTQAGQQTPSQPAAPIKLEGPDNLLVLYRVEQKSVQKIRVFSPDCELDAGGRTIHWLQDVTGADSVALLSTFVGRDEEKSNHLVDQAITAIALHKDPAADVALERFAASQQPESVRKKAVFWLGQARGRRGFEAVVKVAQSDASDEVRKSAMFAISQSREPEGTETLIQFAKQDSSAKIRGEAIFWLSQKAGRKAAAEITAAIESDPDTDVKKRAVFALSQLPKDEAVPLLIDVAKTNRNAAVRKQAMFWLGQSHDPRALEFFAQVLTK